jgi:type VI secretion system protein VasG
MVPYYPLPDKILGDIVKLQLNRIARRIGEQHKVPFTYDDAVVKLVVSRCTEVESGGRMIDAILTNTILPRISEEYLARMVAGRQLGAITLGVRNGDFVIEIA